MGTDTGATEEAGESWEASLSSRKEEVKAGTASVFRESGPVCQFRVRDKRGLRCFQALASMMACPVAGELWHQNWGPARCI